MNFYVETYQEVQKSGHTTDEVTFVGNRYGTEGMHWHTFVSCAQFPYDSGYGAAEIDEDLIIQFSDGSWLERREYDGSEWWEHVKPLPLYQVSESRSVKLGRTETPDYMHKWSLIPV